MKKYKFPTCQQTLLFELFTHYADDDMRNKIACHILGLPEPEIEKLKQAVATILTLIPYKQREVLKLRYAIDTGLQPLTRKAIGKMFNFSEGCARQHELKAGRLCRHPTRIHLLQPFVPPE